MPRVRLAVAGVVLSGCAFFSACGGGDGGSTFHGSNSKDAGSSSGDAGPLNLSSSSSGSGTGSGSGAGASSGAGGSGASSSGMVYTCTGCIDLNGACNDGGADNRCGLNSGTCVDCTRFDPPQVCGANGSCSNGPSGVSSSGSGAQDAGGG